MLSRMSPNIYALCGSASPTTYGVLAALSLVGAAMMFMGSIASLFGFGVICSTNALACTLAAKEKYRGGNQAENEPMEAESELVTHM